MTRPAELQPNEIQKHDQLVHAHLATSSDLIEEAIRKAVREFPGSEAGLRRSLHVGDMVRLSTTFAPAAGNVLLQIDLVALNGEARSLMTCRLQQESVQ